MTIENRLIFYVNGIKIVEKFGDTEVSQYHTSKGVLHHIPHQKINFKNLILSQMKPFLSISDVI